MLPGRKAIQERHPELRRRWALDFVVVNGENAAGGFGITEATCDEILAAGADCVTTGNHVFDQREALVFIERQPPLLRPVKFRALFAARRGEWGIGAHSAGGKLRFHIAQQDAGQFSPARKAASARIQTLDFSKSPFKMTLLNSI